MADKKKGAPKSRAARYPRHGTDYPFDPVAHDELETVVAIVHESGRFRSGMRFIDISLKEPPKDFMESYRRGQPYEREAEVVLIDNNAESSIEAVVSLSRGEVVEWAGVSEPGQPMLSQDEFVEMTIACMQDEEVSRALEKRGLDIAERGQITVDPLSAGNFGDEEDPKRRLVRAFFLMRKEANDNAYAHPIEGLSALVDLHKQQVVRVDDAGVVPVPQTMRNYERQYIDKFRDDIKPIRITQPEGVSFSVDGWRVDWQRWNFRVGFNAREGLVLHDLRYNDVDKGKEREICYRASIAEMTVPYCDASPTTSRKNAFDVGEYGLGTLTNSLTLGCDCLGEVTYFDYDYINTFGEVESIPNAVCMHEEDDSILWKHTDLRSEKVELRRSRKLIVSFISTVGNYEYWFYWVLRQDGSIELEVKAIGIMQTGAVKPGDKPKFGTMVEEGCYAPNHQHFFCARLDMHVDGRKNQVVETESKADPIGPDNPYGNAFYAESRVFKTEKEAQRIHDFRSVRTWSIQNRNSKNRMGANVGYRIQPMEVVLPFFQEGSSVSRRAAYLKNHLWVTPYNENERYPAGKYVNQSDGHDGLPKWTEADRNIEDEDIVVWYVFGHHHVPRLEDWPMMPTAKLGFMLKPSNFFDIAPCLDVPPSTRKACCAEEAEDGDPYMPQRQTRKLRRTVRFEHLKAEAEGRLEEARAAKSK